MSSNSYTTQNQWGGNQAPWHNGGVWIIGGRQNQKVVKVDADSQDGGCSLFGTMAYSGEGPIGFKATRIGGNNWKVENQWGGSQAPWHQGGTWTIGCREQQPVVSLHIGSSDQGNSLIGHMTYKGEGPIAFKGHLN